MSLSQDELHVLFAVQARRIGAAAARAGLPLPTGPAWDGSRYVWTWTEIWDGNWVRWTDDRAAGPVVQVQVGLWPDPLGDGMERSVAACAWLPGRREVGWGRTYETVFLSAYRATQEDLAAVQRLADDLRQARADARIMALRLPDLHAQREADLEALIRQAVKLEGTG